MFEEDEDDAAERKGRGHPPKQHQFRKGHSGNPKGRPKQQPNGKLPTTLAGDELILKEASRIIVTESGEHLSVEQVVLRATAANASRKNASAQRTFLEAVIAAKEREQLAYRRFFESAVLYKRESDAEHTKARQRRRRPPVRIPDPDNIILDFQNMGVWIYGGVTEEQVAARRALEDILKISEYAICILSRAVRRYPHHAPFAKLLAGQEARRLQIEELELNEPDYFGPCPEEMRPPAPSFKAIELLRSRWSAR